MVDEDTRQGTAIDGTAHEDGSARPGRWGRRSGADRITRVAGGTLHVRRAFGEPVRHADVVLLPVARVAGVTGSGEGHGSAQLGAGATLPGRGGGATLPGRGEGTSSGGGGGGGFAVRVTPIGVYEIRGSTVRWRPVVDVGRLTLGGQVVGAVTVLAVAWVVGRWRTARR